MGWTVVVPLPFGPGNRRSIALQGAPDGLGWRCQRGRRYISISQKSAFRLIRLALRLDPDRFAVSVQPEHRRALESA